jgi:hypothetical protein
VMEFGRFIVQALQPALYAGREYCHSHTAAGAWGNGACVQGRSLPSVS